MRLKADLHMHTTYSDGVADPLSMIMASIEKGLSVISITDHDTFEGSRAAMRIVKDKGLDVVVIPGNEVRVKYMGRVFDVLILCPSIPQEEPPRDALRLYDYAKKHSCLYVPAHPFDVRRYGAGDLIYDLKMDALEIWNARAPTGANKQAITVAKELGVVGLANSDAHDVDMVGAAHNVIEVEEDPTPEDVLESIVKGRVKPVFGKVSIQQYGKYVTKKLLRKISKMSFYEKID